MRNLHEMSVNGEILHVTLSCENKRIYSDQRTLCMVRCKY